MAVRGGMQWLIDDLRQLTDTAINETVVNGVSFWTDQQLQDVLDENIEEVFDTPFTLDSRYYDSVRETRRYLIAPGFWELPIETGNRFQVVNNVGVVLEWDDFTFSPSLGLVEFATDQAGIQYYLRGYRYDLYYSASEVWSRKAGFRANLIEWKAGAQSLKEDQEYKHCLERAEFYRRSAGMKTIRMVRLGYHG